MSNRLFDSDLVATRMVVKGLIEAMENADIKRVENCVVLMEEQIEIIKALCDYAKDISNED